jgi:hypothetical protein
MKSRIYLVALVGLAMMLVGSEAWAVCYVDQNAQGRNNGTTWGDAYVHPQLALINGCTEIWVAKGVYTPVLTGSDATVSFEIPAGTKMYGGFAGGESSVDQRLPSVNQTVLSGDVDHNDHDPGNWMSRTFKDINGRNSYHVVTMNGNSPAPITTATVLDGFLIAGGNAPEGADIEDGGAIYCEAGDAPGECSPSLSNLGVIGNAADNVGGAMSLNGRSSPRIVDTTFAGNYAFLGDGGAVSIRSSSTDPNTKITIVNCAFLENGTNNRGGAISIRDNAIGVINSTFFNNYAIGYSGGAIDIDGSGSLSALNSTFVNNTSHGAAISNRLTGSGSIFISNSIFWNNKNFAGGTADVENYYMTDVAYVAASVLENGCPDTLSVCLNVTADDPKLGEPGDHGGATITLIPAPGGSAIDKGDNSGCPSVDQRGVPRTDGHCDIGAVEWRLSDDIIFRNGFQ